MNDFFTELDSDLQSPTPSSSMPSHRTADAGKHTQIHTNKNIPNRRLSQPKKDTISESSSWGVTNHIVEMRSQMMKAGVVVVVFKADEKSKTLLGHLKLETRGFAYVDEVRELHKAIIKKARASYEDTTRDIPDIEEKDLIKIIRRDLEVFLTYKTERTPVVIPMILYV